MQIPDLKDLPAILKQAHECEEGHIIVTRMKATITEMGYFWENMVESAHEFILSCEFCLEHNNSYKEMKIIIFNFDEL